jgi:hypothetical protein
MFAKIVLALPFVSGESSTVAMHSKLITVLPFEFEFNPISLTPVTTSTTTLLTNSRLGRC